MIPKNVPSHRPIRKMPIAGDRTRRRWRYRGAEMTGGGTFPNEALGETARAATLSRGTPSAAVQIDAFRSP